MSEVVASWTEDRVARLKQLLGAGGSATSIAEDLGGVSRNGVIGKVHRLGLAFARGWGEHEDAAEKKARDARPRPVRNAKPPRVAKPAARNSPAPRPVVARTPDPDVEPTPKRWPKPAGPEAVTLGELDMAGQCRMPLWADHEKAGLYCGKPVRFEGQRWCAACAGLVFEARPIRSQEEGNAARARRAKQLSRDGAFA